MLKKIRNMADRYERNKLCIAIAVLSILIFFAPNYRKGLIEGSDAPFHLARIDSLAQDLSKGIFPIKVHTELGYDYGYGVGLFYQNHFLYLPAFLRLLGCSLETSYKISATVLLVFCAALAVSALDISDDWKKILVVMNFVIAVYFGIGMINGLNMDERTADYSERIIYEEIAGFGAGEE
jgi:hypothetical protein